MKKFLGALCLLWLLGPLAWGRGGGGCFEAGTLVETPRGEVPIEQLRAGDIVCGAVGPVGVESVVEVEPDEYLEFTSGQRTIRVTAEHPFQIAPGVFQTAEICLAGAQRVPAQRPAYNLLVERGGTFIVNGMVVHNKGCFLPDTPILKADGTRVPISQLKCGDALLAFTRDGVVVATTVRNILTHDVDEYLIVTTDRIAVKVTMEHPFYVGQGVFKTVEALAVGDTVYGFDGAGLSAQKIVSIKTVHQATRVFNLQTDAPNTFFANGIAVHNKGGGGGCFEKGTLVETPGGEVAIDQLRIGDVVCGASGPAVVESLMEVDPDEYVEFHAGGRTLHVTEEHPFQISPGVFQMAGKYLTGARRVAANDPAYNLLVSPGGTFIVSGMVVHNKGCFLPDTPILRADGSSTAISQLRCGDELLAFRMDGSVAATTVRKILTHDVEEYLVVKTALITVRVTMEHPFYVGQGLFKTVEALSVGDVIYAFDGVGLRAQTLVSLTRIHQPTRVFNLQTDAPNTFFANGIAVHNKGGGGGFGGGYHGGHSSGPSRPMTEEERKWFIRILVTVLVIMIICYIYANCRSADENLDFSYSANAIGSKAAKTAKLIEFIARTDANFTEQKLRETATTSFLKMQDCWQRREYGEMESRLMPNLYREHCQQIASLKRNHEINMIESPRVNRVDIVNVRYTQKPTQREYTALISASARDYYLDDRSRRFLRGDNQSESFQEFWTFQFMEGKWLLREIEQTRESDALRTENFFEPFTDQGVDQVYGAAAGQSGPAGPWLPKAVETKATRTDRLLNFLVQTDKLWDQAAMLERARKIFMDVLLLREAGDASGVSDTDLYPEIATSLRAEIGQRSAAGAGIEYRNLCVRKVEIVLVRNLADNTRDEFVVRISAHAQRTVTSGGAVVGQDEFVTPFVQYWTFGRSEKLWKLKEVLPESRGEEIVKQENVDEESSPEKLEWYYRHTRAT